MERARETTNVGCWVPVSAYRIVHLDFFFFFFLPPPDRAPSEATLASLMSLTRSKKDYNGREYHIPDNRERGERGSRIHVERQPTIE